jgi:hypothetical protein
MVPSCFRVLGVATALSATLGVGFYALHAAHADSAPVIAVPGHLGVPVIINGIDATGAEVFGDWGLSRPGHGSLIIEGGTPMPLQRPPLRYFPTSDAVSDPGARPTKAMPPASRATPPPARPRASTDFHQSWSAGSNPTPLGDGAPAAIVVPPAVVVPPRPPYPHRVPPGTSRP